MLPKTEYIISTNAEEKKRISLSKESCLNNNSNK